MAESYFTRIVISKRAHLMLKSRAAHPFKESAFETADGMMSVPISWHTYHQLRDWMYEGESLSDTIERLCKQVRV